MKRNLIATVLAGILSFGGNTSYSQAQQAPKFGEQVGISNPQAAAAQSLMDAQVYSQNAVNPSEIVKRKDSRDYLVEADITAVIYAHLNNKAQVLGSKGPYISGIAKYQFDTITGQIKNFLEQSGTEFTRQGFVCDDSNFSYKMRPFSEREFYGEVNTFRISGNIANRDATLTINLKDNNPVDATGAWGDLEIKVAYSQSKDLPWLIDHKDVSLSGHGILETYRVKYDFTKLYENNSTLIVYKGFTVTRLNPESYIVAK